MPSSADMQRRTHSFPTRRSSDLQTKEKLTTRHASKLLELCTKDAFELWLNQHPDEGKKIAELAIEQALARLSKGKKFERKKSSGVRSEEHTSELQSRRDLVCRLLPTCSEEHTLSLHDALPICRPRKSSPRGTPRSSSSSAPRMPSSCG